jgi:hypothetical protein
MLATGIKTEESWLMTLSDLARGIVYGMFRDLAKVRSSIDRALCVLIVLTRVYYKRARGLCFAYSVRSTSHSLDYDMSTYTCILYVALVY